MTKDCEIELKLRISPDDVAAFKKLPLLREKCIEGPTRRKLVNVYFDTPDLLLKQNAMALRLRKVGGKWLQTLKTAGTSTGALHQRGEWEYPLPAPELDLALFRETPLGKLDQSSTLHLTLKPVFITEFQRTAWLLETTPGQHIEVALDQGIIRCGEKEATISEVEIELKAGGAALVYDTAVDLAGQISLRPEILSKAERGFRLFQPEPLASTRARAIVLKKKSSAPEAMQAIAAACLTHFETNLEGALTTDDPEYIHQLRVALRRLRSAMRVFRPVATESIVSELKWLTAALGEVRDWDVLTSQTLPSLLEGYGDAGLADALVAAGTHKKSAARRSARAALASSRETHLVLAIGRWISVPGELTLLPARGVVVSGETQAPAMHSLSDFASHEIRRRHRRLLRTKDSLTGMSAEARHAVRIEAKRLRYAVEFFSSLFQKKSVTEYLNVLSEIQDLLGEANDGAIATALVESLAPPQRFVDFAHGWFAARTRAALANVDRCMAELQDTRRFWNKKAP